MHPTAEFAFIGDNADLGSAVLFTDLDATKGLAQGPPCRLGANFAADDPQAHSQIPSGVIAFLPYNLAKLSQEGGEGMDDGHLCQLHDLDVEVGHADTPGQDCGTKHA